jgi:hypothetical protein
MRSHRWALALVTAIACSRSHAPLGATGDALNDPGARAVDAASGGASSSIRPAWTAASTLKQPPAPLAAGVTGIVAHVPEGYDAARPMHLVLFFHGSDMCAAQLAMGGDIVCKPGTKPDVGAGLAARHDDAGTQSLFAAPEIVLWGGGSAGRFAQPPYLRTFLSELASETFAPGLGAPRTVDDVADVTLVGHSAGHLPVVAILRRAELADRVRNVVLIDAFYENDADAYERWLDRAPPGSPRKLVSVHGTWGGQAAHARQVADYWARSHPGRVAVDPPGALEEAIRTHDVTAKTWKLEHAWMLLLVFTKTIAGLDLPARDIAWMRAPVVGTLRPARAVAIGQDVPGTLDDGDTVLVNGSVADDYTIALLAHRPVDVDVRGHASFTEYADLDTYLQVLAPDGHELAHDDDSGGFFDPHLYFDPPAEGTYTIRISTHGSGRKRGPYTLHVSQ